MPHKDKFPRKSDASPLKEAIEEMLNTFDLKRKYTETQIVHSWDKLMGPTIANRTEKIFISKKKLYIKLTSAPLKQELSMSKNKIIEIFEKEFGKGVIEEIILL